MMLLIKTEVKLYRNLIVTFVYKKRIHWHFYVNIFIFENSMFLYVLGTLLWESPLTLVVLQQLRRDFWILLRMLLDAKCKRLMSERSWVHWNLAWSFSFTALPRSPPALISGFSSKRLCWNVQCTFPMPVNARRAGNSSGAKSPVKFLSHGLNPDTNFYISVSHRVRIKFWSELLYSRASQMLQSDVFI